ncbi:MAG: hypothetical protein NTV86_22450 [Planctomycetota bacterium]|nr:hypothetical protein [Planctomycetota bacterium]
MERCASIYLQPGAGQVLTIEVDAVEGCQPDQAALDDLGEFLKTHTSREIDWVRKEPIPRSAAQGVPAKVLATRNARGLPLNANQAGGAYLYVLFYDGGNKGPWGHTAAFYPCIAVDMSASSTVFPGLGARRFLSLTLRHEAGHVLGLCRNPKHGNGAHCTNESCLMWARVVATVSIGKAIFGGDPVTEPPKKLCEACRADLLSIRRAAPPSGMAFTGPFLVRKEEQYTVASLPAFHYLDLGGPKGSWEELLSVARREYEAVGGNKRIYTFAFTPCPKSASDFQRILPRLRAAQKDPNPEVCQVAKTAERDLAAKYGAAEPASSSPSTHQAPPAGPGQTTPRPGSSTRPGTAEARPGRWSWQVDPLPAAADWKQAWEEAVKYGRAEKLERPRLLRNYQRVLEANPPPEIEIQARVAIAVALRTGFEPAMDQEAIAWLVETVLRFKDSPGHFDVMAARVYLGEVLGANYGHTHEAIRKALYQSVLDVPEDQVVFDRESMQRLNVPRIVTGAWPNTTDSGAPVPPDTPEALAALARREAENRKAL